MLVETWALKMLPVRVQKETKGMLLEMGGEEVLVMEHESLVVLCPTVV